MFKNKEDYELKMRNRLDLNSIGLNIVVRKIDNRNHQE